MAQLIENPPDFACQDLEKKKNKILARFISWEDRRDKSRSRKSRWFEVRRWGTTLSGQMAW